MLKKYITYLRYGKILVTGTFLTLATWITDDLLYIYSYPKFPTLSRRDIAENPNILHAISASWLSKPVIQNGVHLYL